MHLCHSASSRFWKGSCSNSSLPVSNASMVFSNSFTASSRRRKQEFPRVVTGLVGEQCVLGFLASTDSIQPGFDLAFAQLADLRNAGRQEIERSLRTPGSSIAGGAEQDDSVS